MISRAKNSRIRWWLARSLLLWRGSGRSRVLAFLLCSVVAVAFLPAVLAFFGVFDLGAFLGLDQKCRSQSVSCGILVELLGAILVVGFAFVYLVVWRLWRVVTRGYVKEALKDPAEVVQTATPMPEVVGRDDLCDVIEDDLLADEPRPQVIVGRVGAGKTAVLVQLTRMLAERGAVPVPVHLRDARKDELDFHALAQQRFLQCVHHRLLYQDEGDRIWRRLWNSGLVVVLADGLEEALLDVGDHRARARSIRRGVEAAARLDHMRLLIAARPDETLADLEAAVVMLEPLHEEEVVKHICGARSADEEWVRTLAGVADLGEMPVYLKLARDLFELNELGKVPGYVLEPGEQGSNENVTPGDLLDRLIEIHKEGARLALRIGLLDRWRQCLLDGRALPQAAAMSPMARSQAIAGLEGMASTSLLENTLEFLFKDIEKLPEHLEQPDLVASHAEQLELAESLPEGVRFRHSIMQAYLGSRSMLQRLQAAEGLGTLNTALSGNPSRELLMALVMCCFRAPDETRRDVRDQLDAEASKPSSSETARFELFAAAYEIDGMLSREGADALDISVRHTWNREHSGQSDGAMAPSGEARLEEAKLRAVEQIGKAGASKAQSTLWYVCEKERSYVVRLHAAQALGTGADAFAVLEPEIKRARQRCKELLRSDGGSRASLEDVRLLSLQGWILPLLAATCPEAHAKGRSDIPSRVGRSRWTGSSGRRGVPRARSEVRSQSFAPPCPGPGEALAPRYRGHPNAR